MSDMTTSETFDFGNAEVEALLVVVARAILWLASGLIQGSDSVLAGSQVATTLGLN
jgi:hypothetical protein